MSALFPEPEEVSPQRVNSFHNNADVDSSDLAMHHTLGYGAQQAAPGLSVSNRFSDHEDRIAALEGDPEPLHELYEAQSAAVSSIGNGVVVLIGGWVTQPAPKNAAYFTYSGGIWTTQVGGLYRLTAGLTYTANAAGSRFVYFFKNGAQERFSTFMGSPNTFGCHLSIEMELDVGDTIDVRANQTSGAALALSSAAQNHYFQAVRYHA